MLFDYLRLILIGSFEINDLLYQCGVAIGFYVTSRALSYWSCWQRRCNLWCHFDATKETVHFDRVATSGRQGINAPGRYMGYTRRCLLALLILRLIHAKVTSYVRVRGQ